MTNQTPMFLERVIVVEHWENRHDPNACVMLVASSWEKAEKLMVEVAPRAGQEGFYVAYEQVLDVLDGYEAVERRYNMDGSRMS